jgi:hypothetical protein
MKLTLRRNMPKHVGSDPPPCARGAPPGVSFARETPGPRSRGLGLRFPGKRDDEHIKDTVSLPSH